MNKYEIVLHICQTHSLSQTAAQLNYSQSAVSQAVKSLEKELGLSLFTRSKRGMELRPNLEELMQSLRRICQEEQRIHRIAADLTSLEKGYIRIGTIQSIAYHWLPAMLRQFARAYPHIRFEMTVAGFQDLHQSLLAGTRDCIFTSHYAAGSLPFTPLGDDELLLVLPRHHRLVSALQVSITDLEGEDFILSSDGLAYETGRIFELNHITPVIRYHIDDDYAVCKMVEQGFGISILPKLLLHHIPFHVCIRPFTEGYTRTLGIAHRDEEISPALTKFLEYAAPFPGKDTIAP